MSLIENVNTSVIRLGQTKLHKISGPTPAEKLNGNGKQLTMKEKLDVRQMEQIERSIREHERAHQRVARDLMVGGPSFEYKKGPDGKKYAVHGEVDIDASLSGISDPREAIEKALKIQRAALAPSDPSSKDLEAAAHARLMESKAHRKLARQEQQETATKKENSEPGQIPVHPGAKAYELNMQHQENLFKILDLFG